MTYNYTIFTCILQQTKELSEHQWNLSLANLM